MLVGYARVSTKDQNPALVRAVGKPCRSGVMLGNSAADVSRRNFLGFRLTPPSRENIGRCGLSQELNGFYIPFSEGTPWVSSSQ